MIQRRKTIQTDRKPKPHLPAAIFNRTFQSQQNNSTLSNISSFDHLKCQNHPNKKGKFSVLSEEEGEEIYYCQKCAILLASQGFKVLRLEGEQQSERKTKRKPQNRQEELEEFLRLLDEKLREIGEFKQNNLNVLKTFQIWEDEAHEKVDMFFEEVLAMISRQKEKYQTIIDIKKSEMEQTLEKELLTLEDQAMNLHQMKEDIESSYESIVRETPEEDYNLVMGHYRNNISQLKLNKLNFETSYPVLPNLGDLEGAIEELFDGENPSVSSRASFVLPERQQY